MPPTDITIKIGVIGLLLLGAMWDARTRRIPNYLTFGGAAVGLVANVATHGPAAAMSSIEGWIFGALLLVIPFALRGIGGGDVKLLAAAGAWGGPDFAFQTALLGALAGALVAIILLVVNGRLAETFRPVIRWGRIELALVVGSVAPSAVDWVAPPPTIDDSPPREKIWFPYGPVLAVGGLAALVLGNS